jgi:hypothetical protein
MERNSGMPRPMMLVIAKRLATGKRAHNGHRKPSLSTHHGPSKGVPEDPHNLKKERKLVNCAY